MTANKEQQDERKTSYELKSKVNFNINLILKGKKHIVSKFEHSYVGRFSLIQELTERKTV